MMIYSLQLNMSPPGSSDLDNIVEWAMWEHYNICKFKRSQKCLYSSLCKAFWVSHDLWPKDLMIPILLKAVFWSWPTYMPSISL